MKSNRGVVKECNPTEEKKRRERERLDGWRMNEETRLQWSR